MAPDANIEGPAVQLTKYLASQVTLKEREADFDMDDAPEAQVLAPFGELQDALGWLESKITGLWQAANQEALRCQARHRRLARVAIAAGTAAIVLAVVQLSIKQTLPGLTTVALVLELIAVAAAVIAVVVGLKAKFDRRWLGQRHRAQRLRMIKFRSLVQLWCLEPDLWQESVRQQLSMLADTDDVTIDKWLREEIAEPIVLDSLKCEPDAAVLRALTIYYRFKRVEFQASYFNRRREDFERETGRWLHLSLPLFLISVACVVIHFALEMWAHRLDRPGSEAAASYFEAVAVWFVALAAIIPVLGVGVRAWFSAFELPRSANLFAAKHRALQHLTNSLQEDAGKVLPTLRHMVQAEYFLEQEHREWLRLLRDTEWFL
jgi:hypothetical protein